MSADINLKNTNWLVFYFPVCEAGVLWLWDATEPWLGCSRCLSSRCFISVEVINKWRTTSSAMTRRIIGSLTPIENLGIFSFILCSGHKQEKIKLSCFYNMVSCSGTFSWWHIDHFVSSRQKTVVKNVFIAAFCQKLGSVSVAFTVCCSVLL